MAIAGSRGVALLGEVGVAASAARDRVHQQLVVTEANADGRGLHATGLGGARDRLETIGLDDALVGATVGQEHERRATVALHAARFLDAAQEASGEVGHGAGPQGPHQVLNADFVGEWSRRHGDLDVGVERDEPEVVGRVEPREQRVDRLLRSLEPPVRHRPAAVEHELERARRALAIGGRLGRGQLEQDRDPVLGLERDQVDVENGVQLHASEVEPAHRYLTERPFGAPVVAMP